MPLLLFQLATKRKSPGFVCDVDYVVLRGYEIAKFRELQSKRGVTTLATQAKITPIELDGEYYFLSSELEGPLGFSDLADSLRKSPGFIHDVDYVVLRGYEINQLRAVQDKRSGTPFDSIGNKVNCVDRVGPARLRDKAIGKTRSVQ